MTRLVERVKEDEDSLGHTDLNSLLVDVRVMGIVVDKLRVLDILTWSRGVTTCSEGLGLLGMACGLKKKSAFRVKSNAELSSCWFFMAQGSE